MTKPKPEAAAGQQVEPEAADEPQVDLLGQLNVTLDGTDFILRPSRQALTNIEQQTGKSLMSLTAQATALMLPLAEAGICVAEMMRATAAFDPDASADYKGAKPDRCADLIFESNSLTVQSRLGVIFKNALTGGYTASGEAKAVGMKTTTEPTPTAA